MVRRRKTHPHMTGGILWALRRKKVIYLYVVEVFLTLYEEGLENYYPTESSKLVQ